MARPLNWSDSNFNLIQFSNRANDWFINFLLMYSSTDWLIDWLTDWLTDWLCLDRLNDWLIDWFIATVVLFRCSINRKPVWNRSLALSESTTVTALNVCSNLPAFYPVPRSWILRHSVVWRLAGNGWHFGWYIVLYFAANQSINGMIIQQLHVESINQSINFFLQKGTVIFCSFL